METDTVFPVIESGWYIAAPSSRLVNRPLACRVLDHDIVLFRDAAGTAHALRDRCCHRGVRLSLGTVSADHLVCAYHGWCYDGEGRCVHIPSLPSNAEPARRAGVRAFPCVEQDAYLWVWTGVSDAAPARPAWIEPMTAYIWQQGTLPMQCAATLGIENNLDWCHPVFAHPWAHGQFFRNQLFGFAEHAYETRLTDTGMVLFGPATASASDPIPENGWFKARFDLPGRLTLEFGADQRTLIIMHFVPTGPNTCRLEWLNSIMPSSAPLAGVRARWSEEEPVILAQDRALLESAQRAYDREGGEFENSVGADTSTLLARRIIALAAQGRWPGAHTTLPYRRVVTVRAKESCHEPR